MDAHIKNIRKKIEADPKNPEYIITRIGAGYKFNYWPDGN
jgi:DNA-binding response OmpR family regulator